MKKIASISYVLLLLLFVSSIHSPVATGFDGDKTSINPSFAELDTHGDFEGEYYPIFVSVNASNPSESTKVQELRERNGTIGQGGVVKVDALMNVTFTYAIALDNDTVFDNSTLDFRLFADLPVVNTTEFNNTASNNPLSLTDAEQTLPLNFTNEDNPEQVLNYTLPYDNTITMENASLYYMKTVVELNVTSDFIRFYVRNVDNGLSEIRSTEPYNLLTTQTYWNTSSQDEFYIQNEIVNVTSSVYNANSSDVFGIKYRTSKDGGSFSSYKNLNSTISVNGNASELLSTDEFEPVTTFQWQSVAFVNDTQTNITRTIDRIEFKEVEIGDGTPTLSTEIVTDNKKTRQVGNLLYSQQANITFNATATVPKGNITLFQLIPDIEESPLNFVPGVNQTLSNDELTISFDYSTIENTGSGVFNATIYAETDKGLNVNETFDVIFEDDIEENRPTGSLTLSGGQGGQITTKSGAVSFEFSFADNLSGVRVAYLDLGDGSSKEVTALSSYTHTYIGIEDSENFEVTLTIMDNVGLERSITVLITVQMDRVGTVSPPIVEFIIFIASVVGLGVLYYYADPISVRLRDLYRSIKE